MKCRTKTVDKTSIILKFKTQNEDSRIEAKQL